MRSAKNLMVHIGGFSMLGALTFSGDNLFITNEFYPLKYENNHFFNYVNKYIIL